MADMSGKEIRMRYDAQVSQRKTLDETLESIKNTMMPYRGEFFRDMGSEHSIDWSRPRYIYDSTGAMGIQTLAAAIHGDLTSPENQWFYFQFRDSELRDDHESQKWLDNATSVVYTGLQDSNFNLEVNEVYTDMVGFGTSIIVEEEDQEVDGDFDFQSIPIEQGYFEQDYRGRACAFYRKLNWSPLQVLTKFGDDCPKWVKDRTENPNQAESKILVIFSIYKRKPGDYTDDDTLKVIAASSRPYGSKYIIHADGEEIGEPGGYYEMPAFIPRWRKTSDSMWGNSPAMMALADVLTLNQMVQMGLTAQDKAINPATIVTERGLLSDLDLSAGGLTVARDTNSIFAHESKARFDVTEAKENQYRSAIRAAFYVDQLQLKDSPAMTATEVNARVELMQRLLGPTVGRITTDMLTPLLQRSLRIKMRSGTLGEMPALLKSKGGHIDMVYTGQLARAQKSEQAAAIERWVGSVGELGNVFPDIKDIPDVDEVGRELADLRGIPEKLVKSKALVNTERQARQQAQAAQAKSEQEKTQGEADKTNAEANAIVQ